jgi:hypothetical protein
LQAGAPTNLQLLFGSQGNPIDDALNPSYFGLSIPHGGKLIVELSPEFIYDTNTALSPIPNSLVDLAIASENPIFGDPCPYNGAQAATVCGGWTSAFGGSSNEIQFIPPVWGLIGERASQVGIKLAHIHPFPGNATGLYRNVFGVCRSDTNVYCLDSDDCLENKDVCDLTALPGSVTATVLDALGNVVYKEKQVVEFQQLSQYNVYAVNLGLTEQMEVVESIDYYECVEPDTTVDTKDKVPGEIFSSGGPYAPRFMLFPPQDIAVLSKKKVKPAKEENTLTIEIQAQSSSSNHQRQVEQSSQ